jgi:hypothetical protein
LLSVDPLVQEYRAFFSLFDWSVVDQWQAERSSRGRPGHPESAYLKAFLIRIHHKFIYASELRYFLVTHPLLIIELGFRLVLGDSAPYGFDCEQTLPSRFWLSSLAAGSGSEPLTKPASCHCDRETARRSLIWARRWLST